MEDDEVEFESEVITIGPHTFSLTTISFMPLEKLLENQTKGIEISGQKVWCGSVVASEYLLRHPEFVNHKCVVELGSGTGIVGMMCHKLGADSVFLTDHDIRSINHMNIDIQANNIVNTQVHILDWFQEDQCNPLLAEVRVLLDQRQLLLVAGDVLYKAVLLIPFFATVKRILEEQNNLDISTSSDMQESLTISNECCRRWELLLCHVPRAGVEHSQVIEAATTAGLNVSIVDEQEWKSGAVLEITPQEDYDRAQLYRMTLL